MKHIDLPDQGYTPANYAQLVELTELSNVAFCELFDIPKGTFEKHKSGKRTMKWQDWQTLLTVTEQYLMSTYITCVGRARINNFSFDVHENKDGSASIRANKLGHDLPAKTWLTYDSVDSALEYIESVCGDLEGAQRALYFWEYSAIAEKIEEKEHYYSQRDYES